VRQPGAQSSQQTQLPSGLQLGTGVRPVATERIFTQGNVNQTSNDKDVAIQGARLFPGIDAGTAPLPTRADGAFQTDSQGQLVTSSGYVVQPPITVPANATKLTVGRDGTVSITQPGTAANTQIGTLQVSTFINPAGLESRGENLYVETAASGTPNPNTPGTNGAGALWQGYVETSNVNVVEELVNMIQTQRAYEINSKAITTSDQMLAKLSQL